MAGDGVIFTREEARRTEASVKHFERSQRGILAPALKKVRASGGSAATCTDQLRLNIFGNPTGGSLIIPVTHTDESDVETTENVTIAFDDTTTEIETAFAGHSKITSADVEVTSPGGPLPNQEMTITFKNDVALSDLSFGVVNSSGLTGGASWTFAYLRTCCGD